MPRIFKQQHIILESFKGFIEQLKAEHYPMIQALPNRAKTDAQKVLQVKHGAPRTYAYACFNAIGEISLTEAMEAIKQYKQEWNDAK